MATSVDAPQKNTKRTQKKYTWAYSWTWRHNAALLQTVGSTLPQALWHRQRREESECRPDMIRMIENHRFPEFFDP